MKILFEVSSGDAANILLPLARACDRNAVTWGCFFTGDGVKTLAREEVRAAVEGGGAPRQRLVKSPGNATWGISPARWKSAARPTIVSWSVISTRSSASRGILNGTDKINPDVRTP